MTILVTGGAGYIGSHMVHELADAGDSLVVLDNLSTGTASAVPPEVPLVVGNTGDRDLVGSILREHRVSAIIHFAASLIVPESVQDPLGYYLNNTVATRSLLEAAVRGGVRDFIFSSTAAVYGNPAHIPVAEDAPTQPMSPYGSSKLMSEMMLRDVGAAHGLRHVILRYFNVAGADPGLRTGSAKLDATHIFKVAVGAVLGLRPGVDVFGTDFPTPDGTGIRDYIHVTDLVRAHASALRHLRGGGDSLTLNCGYGRGYSVLQVIEAVKRVAGIDFPVRLSDRRPGDPAAVVADTGRIRSLLDWTPQFDDIDTIARHALAWERQLMERRAGAGAEAAPARRQG
jgi:UDP-glucose 4-epimerase